MSQDRFDKWARELLPCSSNTYPFPHGPGEHSILCPSDKQRADVAAALREAAHHGLSLQTNG